ncbi:uncharacterized protein JCM6883_002743 [Sporobolomyces salmoneus]|uniref:uncharacterized protein n=1 Tax=Sporobolomyces salmoneus TaxID=183962 RepID=UPI0031730CAA
MSSTIEHLNSAITRLVPLSLAETSWDNVGLMVEPPKPRTIPSGSKRAVYLCIDLTRSVAQEALSNPSTVSILTYHPPIFSGLKSLTLSNGLSRSLLECVSGGVSVMTVHTAADVAVGGTNDWMATGLIRLAQGRDLSTGGEELIRPGQGDGVRALKEKGNPPEGHEGCGMGRIVTLREVGSSFTKDGAVRAVKATLGLQHFQAAWSETGKDRIKTIAICAGSGSSVLKGVEADLYLTGEMGHHDVLAANAKGIHVFCCNHTATERPWLKYFAPRLQAQLNEIAAAQGGEADRIEYEVIVSEKDREPLEVV